MKALGLPVSEKNFEVCLLCSYVQNCDPRAGASFDPRCIICTTLVEVQRKCCIPKYQSSSPYGLGREDF